MQYKRIRCQDSTWCYKGKYLSRATNTETFKCYSQVKSNFTAYILQKKNLNTHLASNGEIIFISNDSVLPVLKQLPSLQGRTRFYPVSLCRVPSLLKMLLPKSHFPFPRLLLFAVFLNLNVFVFHLGGWGNSHLLPLLSSVPWNSPQFSCIIDSSL